MFHRESLTICLTVVLCSDHPRKWVGVNRHYWKVSSQRLFASNLVSFHPVVLKNIFKGFQFSTNEGKGPLELFAYCELKKKPVKQL